MKQNLSQLGMPNVWGVLFKDNLSVIEVFPKDFDAIDARALQEISEVLKEWIQIRGISEVIDAETKLYAGKVGNMILYATGNENADFTDIWKIVSDVKERYGA